MTYCVRLTGRAHEFRGGARAADGVDGASGAGMVQQDVPEDNHERRNDHTDIDVQILGDLRIVDDGDLLRNEIEVVIFRGRSAPWSK